MADAPDPDSLLDEQVAYYRARAPEYDDWWLRRGRYDVDDEHNRGWGEEKARLARAVADFDARGDVLELAAGTGNLTVELAATADRVTAVDASPEVLAIARTKVGDTVDFVLSDVFAYEPPRRFDAVAFGFWISHVPPARVREFWGLVDRALRPGGRVFFTDNAAPSVNRAPMAASPGSRPWRAEGVAERDLADGRRFTIVKRSWDPPELEAELAELGWLASVAVTGPSFLYGTAVRAGGE